MTGGQKVGLGFLIGGGLLAVGGGIALAVSARKSGNVAGLGRVDLLRARALRPVRTTRGKNGSVLQEYRGPFPTVDRIRLIDQRIDLGMHDPDMRKLSLAVTNHCPARDDGCELQAVWDYMRDGAHAPPDGPPGKIRYSGDGGSTVQLDPKTGVPLEYGPVDIFQSPQRTLEFQAGDCDDHQGVAGTMLAQNGFDVRKKVTAPTASAPDAHIYIEAKRHGSKWIPFDHTLPYATGPGIEHPYGRASYWPNAGAISPKTSAALEGYLKNLRRVR